WVGSPPPPPPGPALPQDGRDKIPSYAVAEPDPSYGDWEGNGPPPPEAFPPGWEETWQPSFEAAALAARPEPIAQEDAPLRLAKEVIPGAPPEPDETEAGRGSGNEAGVRVQAVEAPGLPAIRLPSLYVPVAQAEGSQRPPQQLTVLLRPTGDRARDKRRIKTLHGTLISYHGRDRFSFQIFEGGKGHLIDFPNDTTRVCPEMLERLKKLMGEESWRLEEIAV
ncbi:MAG: hypothetical protein ACOYYJ_20785, partial [Chloroflexota bacterium]